MKTVVRYALLALALLGALAMGVQKVPAGDDCGYKSDGNYHCGDNCGYKADGQYHCGHDCGYKADGTFHCIDDGVQP